MKAHKSFSSFVSSGSGGGAGGGVSASDTGDGSGFVVGSCNGKAGREVRVCGERNS